MNDTLNAPPSPEEQLSELFGSYKAEWLREHLYELFKEPKYFPELITARPCVLMGGRGTGKTSVLRSLSYEGQFTLNGRKPEAVRTAKFHGIYYRVDTNRVTAFRGPELDRAQWIKHFAHYLNLVLSDLLLSFLEWYQLNTAESIEIPLDALKAVSAAFNLSDPTDFQTFSNSLRVSRLKFEAYINNVADGNRPPLSLQGSPVETLVSALAATAPLKGKVFFFLIDEYENFEDYQQEVVNTLIKHSGSLYTFKIGVRELGWRVRATLNEHEQLISPSDYIRINIAEHFSTSEFSAFARDVCNERLSRLQLPLPPASIEALLPGLSEEEEAQLLGVGPIVDTLLAASRASLTTEESRFVESMSPLFVYFVKYRSEADNLSFVACLRLCIAQKREWETNFANYRYALLFTIKKGKRGIHKYYAGWDAFVLMAAGNIRYLLELVVQSLLQQLRKTLSLDSPVAPEIQTSSAQTIGRKNLSELEGLSVDGAQLTKLVLGLGRVFQVLASDNVGHAPEVNQFCLGSSAHGADEDDQGAKLLRAAVMHLALLRAPGNKLADAADTREYDYIVHPIYSAFFEFSYRRKRKLQLSVRQLLGLVHDPRKTIKGILSANNRAGDEPLPEQALLFSSYYGSDI